MKMSNSVVEVPTFARNSSQERLEKIKEMENLRRYTMEKGPVLVEKSGGEARPIGEMFREYMTKTTFLKVGDTQNESYIGMVEPEVKSRNSSKKRPEGHWNPVSGLFKDAALLTANIQAFERGIISEHALLSQYTGNGDVQELKRTLGGLLGRIYYGEPEIVKSKSEKIESCPTMVGVRSSGSGEGTDHVFIVPYADFLKKVERYESKQRSKKIAISSAFLLVTMVACDAVAVVPVETPRATEAIKPSPIVKVTTGSTEGSPTQVATEATNPLKPGKGGSETETVYQSEQSKKEMAALDSCVAYWGGTVPAVALPDQPGSTTASLHYKFMRDLGKNDGSGVVVLETSINDANWNGKVGMQPFNLWKADRQGCNLDEKGKPVQSGMDPFKLSTTSGPELVQYGIPEGSSLAFYNGGWVMVNPTGEIVGNVNDNGDWEKVKTKVDMAKTIPTSEAGIANSCYSVASPIENHTQYKTDMAEYLKVVHEQVIPNHNGMVFRMGNGIIGISAEGVVFQTGADMTPAACAKFTHEGKEVALLTYIAEDSQGKFALNIILDPENVDIPGGDSRRTVDEVLKDLSTDPIVHGKWSTFIAAYGSYSDVDYKSWYSNNFFEEFFSIKDNQDILSDFHSWGKDNLFNREHEDKALILVNWVRPVAE